MSLAKATSTGGASSPSTDDFSTVSSTPATAASSAAAATGGSPTDASLLAQLLAQTRSPDTTAATATPVGAGQVVLGVLESLPGPAGLGMVTVDRIGRLPLIHSVVPLSPEHLGQRLALTVVDGGGLLALGVLWTGDAAPAEPSAEPSAMGTGRSAASASVIPAPSEDDALSVTIDGEREVLRGARELELRCGEACILLTADGRIQLRGTYITSHASATQRIVGGSVHVN